MMNSEEKNITLQKAIVEAIAFFDMFDCPLTLMEVWKFIRMECGLTDVQEILSSGIMIEVGEKNGYYFLAGREGIYNTRMQRYNFAVRKLKRTLLIARIFKLVPWIKMIAVGNMMGANNLRDQSDIDLLVVTEKKRIWLTRLLTVAITAALRMRPQPDNNRDKICLSFFVSENALDLEKLMLKDALDIYFIYWMANLVPVYDADNVFNRLIEENRWLKERLPNWQAYIPIQRRNAGAGLSGFYHDLVDLFIGGLEPQLMEWQIKHLPKNLKELMNKTTSVVVNEKIIKLHSKDRRKEYFEKWMGKIKI